MDGSSASRSFQSQSPSNSKEHGSSTSKSPDGEANLAQVWGIRHLSTQNPRLESISPPRDRQEHREPLLAIVNSSTMSPKKRKANDNYEKTPERTEKVRAINLQGQPSKEPVPGGGHTSQDNRDQQWPAFDPEHMRLIEQESSGVASVPSPIVRRPMGNGQRNPSDWRSLPSSQIIVPNGNGRHEESRLSTSGSAHEWEFRQHTDFDLFSDICIKCRRYGFPDGGYICYTCSRRMCRRCWVLDGAIDTKARERQMDSFERNYSPDRFSRAERGRSVTQYVDGWPHVGV